MNCSTTKVHGSRRNALTGYAAAAIALLASGMSQAAVHGITGASPGATFNLTASAATISQPDGAVIYSWGYGCTGAAAAGYLPAQDAPANQGVGNCPLMQTPGPTMIVTQGQHVTVTLTNALPPAAGATSMVFPGFVVTPSGGAAGLVTMEAVNGATGNTVTYDFDAVSPGTYSYYSGTQTDLQVEMGLYGAIVVLPNTTANTSACSTGPYSLAPAAYDQRDSCYNREYLFQFTELSAAIHNQVKAQVDACPAPTVAAPCAPLLAAMEPYRPDYYLVNGRSMPDDMDIAYAPAYPHQPYNGNPHMHPGENVLMRVVGQGHWQHPFHFHGNHARVLARDAHLLLSQKTGPTDLTGNLAGPLLFTISTVSSQTVDAIFTWTGQGLNWDVYGNQPHSCNTNPLPTTPGDPSAQSAGFDPVTHEFCGDHGKPIPATPPDPSIVVNGQWYAGTPYLGLQTVGNQTPEAPGTLNQNPQGGYAYMWHSHNEREITTNDVFPGGMMMMLLIDPFVSNPADDIDETK